MLLRSGKRVKTKKISRVKKEEASYKNGIILLTRKCENIREIIAESVLKCINIKFKQ
jgi:hypothetical protein